MDLKRGLTTDQKTALDGIFFPALFTYVDWPDETVYVHTSVGTIETGEQEWLGIGRFGNMSIPPETQGVAAIEAMLSLSGVQADLNGYIDDPVRNKTVQVKVGFLTDRPGGHDGKQPGTLIDGLVDLFAGIVDGLSMIDSAVEEGTEHELQISVSTGVEARTNATIYHSDEDQSFKYPGDTAGRLLIYAYSNAQKLTWPAN